MGRGKRGWKKLHVGVDQSGVIVAEALTEATVADATTGIELIDTVDGDLASVTGDAAYDTVAFYDAAGTRRATVVVPPTKTAKVSRRRPRSSARDRTIRTVKQLGRRRWQKVSGYHRQGRVENTFFRYKSIIGERLRARTPEGQVAEALLACIIRQCVLAWVVVEEAWLGGPGARCHRPETAPPEGDRQQQEREPDADFPPDHAVSPRCASDEPIVLTEGISDGASDEEEAARLDATLAVATTYGDAAWNISNVGFETQPAAARALTTSTTEARLRRVEGLWCMAPDPQGHPGLSRLIPD